MHCRFLKCLARAVVKHGVRFLLHLVPGGEVVGSIAADAWEDYRRDPHGNSLRNEVEALAQAPAEQVHRDAAAAVAEAAAEQPAEIRLALTSYLEQVPAAIRRSLRRPSDPTGTTVPADLSLRRPEDLVPLLPARALRFKPGDRPLSGVDWELEELVGLGGFGEVWKARHAHLRSKAPVALKFCLDPTAVAALRNEAGVLDRVMRHGRHPGIVPLLQTYLSAEPPCLEYEYVEGGDLTGLIRELHARGPLTSAQATRLFLRLADIVAFAHQAAPPIVHDDLKPANVLVRRKSGGKIDLRVTDFGIGGLALAQAVRESRHPTRSGKELLTEAVRGAYTPLYASLEQMRRRPGEPADPRDDVHALGIIWYQLLTGDLEMLSVPPDWREQVEGRGLGKNFVTLLASCISPKAEKRPASAGALAQQLRAGLGEVEMAAEAALALPVAELVEEVLPLEKVEPPPLPAEELLKADCRHYEAAYMGDDGEEFLRKQAPGRLRAWRSAAEQGRPEGQVLLAGCFWEGIEVEKDFEEAAAWFRKAAEQGNALAQLSLGVLYKDGEGVGWDDAEAARWYRKAAEQGNPLAQLYLGRSYARGKGLERNDSEAEKWFRRALKWARGTAEQDSAIAQIILGALYLDGCGVEKDEAGAAGWFRRAAKRGNRYALSALGALHLDGRGVPRDYAEAFNCFSRAAERGDRQSEYSLGTMYAKGWGVQKDPVQAVQWYRKAARQGFALAENNLGFHYLEGLGVPKDEAEGVRWIRKAAEKGCAVAQFTLGEMYLVGRGVLPDDREGVRWLRKAAEQGDAAAQSELGAMYLVGRGAPQDEVEAIQWLRKAAAQGDSGGQFLLGSVYETGQGVVRDRDEAVALYRKAADQGHAGAKKRLKVVAPSFWRRLLGGA
jgi:TPR repeat protein